MAKDGHSRRVESPYSSEVITDFLAKRYNKCFHSSECTKRNPLFAGLMKEIEKKIRKYQAFTSAPVLQTGKQAETGITAE